MVIAPGVKSVNIETNEIVSPRKRFVVETTAAVDVSAVCAGLSVRGQPGAARLARNRKEIAWTPTDPLPSGKHTLIIGRMESKRGKAVTDGFEIPFFVVDTKAAIPSTLVVESITRVRIRHGKVEQIPIPMKPRGKYVELMKCRHRKTGKPVGLAFDERGRKVNAERMLRELREKRLRRFGKVHETLYRKLREADNGVRFSVAVWVDSPPGVSFAAATKLKNAVSARRPRSVTIERKIMASAAERFAAIVKEIGGRNIKTDTVAPVVYAKVTKRDLKKLEARPEVLGVFLYDEKGYDDLDDSIAIANSDHVHDAGKEGKGVRVAVWERGPDNTDNLDIEGRFIPLFAATSAHSRLTHAIIKNTEAGAPHGHAPACRLYSANSYRLAALRWAVNNRSCTVINQSFHRDDEQTDGGLSFDDIYKDWLILHWPFPTIVQASGNDPSPNVEYVNHKGYNSLTVGSHDEGASAMATQSVYRNPDSGHADRELPEICANGTSVTAAGHTDGGTSFAAPAVAGITALIQSTDATLKSWPEGCRAILLAGASRNVKDSTWWEDVITGVDAADGAGAVDALESYRIAKSRRSRNSAATRRGWDVGTLRSSDFGSNRLSTFTYKVRIPYIGVPWLFGPRRVKVALAWNSKLVWDFFPPRLDSVLAVDCDLKVFASNGMVVASSNSWDNSYEIAEFDGTPGETYEIKIRRWSGTDSTWYGLAWTVTGGLRLIEAIKRAELVRALHVLETNP